MKKQGKKGEKRLGLGSMTSWIWWHHRKRGLGSMTSQINGKTRKIKKIQEK